MTFVNRVINRFRNTSRTTTKINPPTKAIPMTTTDPVANYAAMTLEQKVASLEVAVTQQGEYIKNFKGAMKVLNRRNTLAIIEMQKLVRDVEIRHPDVRDMVDPVMIKVSEVLDFRKPYDI